MRLSRVCFVEAGPRWGGGGRPWPEPSRENISPYPDRLRGEKEPSPRKESHRRKGAGGSVAEGRRPEKNRGRGRKLSGKKNSASSGEEKMINVWKRLGSAEKRF